MVRLRLAALLAIAALAAAAGAAAAQEPVFNVEIDDRRADADGPLDVVRVSLGPSREEQLAGQVTMARRWDAADLRPVDARPATLCFKLYVRRMAGEEPPDYLACTVAPAEGKELTARVLRNRANGLARTTGVGTVRRLSGRTVELHFPRAAIGSPERLSFVVESVTFIRGCRVPQGCVDLSPEVRPARLQLG